MIQRKSIDLVFDCFFTASGVGKTGLTPTVTVYGPTGSVVSTGSATAVAAGFYTYTCTAANTGTAGNYRAKFVTSDTTVDQKELPGLWVVGMTWTENVDLALSNIGGRLPAALVAGKMDSNVQAIANAILTAASFAANAIDANALAADAGAEIAAAVRTNLTTELGRLDAPVSGVPAAVRTNLTVELARLDTNVNSRLATAGYTAPDNAGIAAIALVIGHLATALEQDGAVWRFTANALEESPAQAASGIQPEDTLETDGVTSIKYSDLFRGLAALVWGSVEKPGSNEFDLMSALGGKVRAHAEVLPGGERVVEIGDMS